LFLIRRLIIVIKIRKKYQKRETKPKDLINQYIKYPKLYLIIDDERIGPISLEEARKKADEVDLDLLVVNQKGDYPTAKILDYGRFKYERSKKEREIKKNSNVVEKKEIRLTVNIDDHDLMTKLKKTREFLTDGNKVKVSLRYRRFELTTLKEVGYIKLAKILENLSDVAYVEKDVVLNKIFLDIYFAPKKQNKTKENDSILNKFIGTRLSKEEMLKIIEKYEKEKSKEKKNV